MTWWQTTKFIQYIFWHGRLFVNDLQQWSNRIRISPSFVQDSLSPKTRDLLCLTSVVRKRTKIGREVPSFDKFVSFWPLCKGWRRRADSRKQQLQKSRWWKRRIHTGARLMKTQMLRLKRIIPFLSYQVCLSLFLLPHPPCLFCLFLFLSQEQTSSLLCWTL